MPNTDVRELSQNEIKDFFINDPTLCAMGLPDSDVLYIEQNNDYYFPEGSTGVGIFDNDELICVFRYDPYTPIAVNVHIYLKSSLQGKHLTYSYGGILVRYVLANLPHVSKIVIHCPKTCETTWKVIQHGGMKLEGVQKNAMVWRGQVTDLLIFGKEIKQWSNT